MGSILKAGGLGSQNFDQSMAQAMEDALNQLLTAQGRPTLDMSDTTETWDRRVMFIAIARGILRHLNDNQAAFDVLHNDNTTFADHKISITTQDQ